MTMPSSRRRAAPFIAAGALCLLAGCSNSGIVERARAGQAKTMVALNDTQLGNIRGGFKVSPDLTINFGFQQVTSVNHNIVSNIVVPNLTISPTAQGTRFSSLASFDGIVNRNTDRSGAASFVPTVAPTVIANSAGQPQAAPSNVTNTVITSTQNQGTTTVLSELGGGGLSTIIGNTANNALVQNMTTINLAISGLQPVIAQGRSNAALGNALAFGIAQF